MTYPSFLSPFIINPSIPLRWYGFMYIFGIFIAVLIMQYAEKKTWIKFNYKVNKKGEKSGGASDFIFYAVFPGVIGGRLGYFLFYDPSGFLRPWEILGFYYNNGHFNFYGLSGMSIHGGLVVGIFGIYIFSRVYKHKFMDLLDIVTIPISSGIFFGRVGNFLNAELYGRVTNSILGMRFPLYESVGGYADWINLSPLLRPYTEPRHPSQLYEAILEGAFLFFLMYILTINSKKIKTGTRFWLWIMLYGLFRTLIEAVREVSEWRFGVLTAGMIYSIPMFILCLIMLIFIYTKKDKNKVKNNA